MREGWKPTTLGEVSDTLLGKTLPRGEGASADGSPYLRNVNLQWGEIFTGNLNQMNFTDSEKEKYKLVSGDLLVCEGGEVGRCAVVERDLDGIYFQNAIHRVRADPKRTSGPFLALTIESLTKSGVVAQFATQQTIAHLSQRRLRALPVTLPPLSEQRRIVDLMHSVDAAISSAQAEVDAVVEMEKAINLEVFRRLFEGPTVQVSDRTDMKLGRQKGGAATIDGPTYATVKSGSISSTHRVDPDTFDKMPIPTSWIELHGLRPGDVVLAEGGTVGESAVWPDHLVGPYGYDKHVIRIRPTEGQTTTDFVAHWCRYMKWSGTFDATATGKTISALGFGRAAKLPIPDLTTNQQEVEVRPLVAIDAAVSAAQSALDRLRGLRSSLLSALLSGEHEIPESYDQFLTDSEEVRAG